MKNRIRILATTDMHGYIYPYRYSDHADIPGGCARLKTLIDYYRDENTILIDNGDVLQGSSLQFYHYAAEPQETAPITKVMNAMGYDYVNLGNHDFNFGEDQLLRHLKDLNMPCITSNVTYRDDILGSSWAVREIAGKKIAIFGLVTHFVPNWEKKNNIRRFKFFNAFETAKKTVEMIRKMEKPDYIIAVYHGSFERNPQNGVLTMIHPEENQAFRMIAQIPGIDVIITGHTHARMCGKAFRSVYVQAGKNADTLACVDIYTDTGIIEPRLLTPDCEPNAEIMEVVQDVEDRCQVWLDEPIGTTPMDLKIRNEIDARLHKSQVVTFLNMVIKDATDADICASSLFHDAPGFEKNITMRDLVSTYTFPNCLVVLWMTGKQLKQYLEITASFWSADHTQIIVNPRFIYPKKKLYFYDMLDGVEYDINVSNEYGHRIENLKYQGKEVTPDMEFTVAMSNYRAAGGSEYELMRECRRVKEVPIEMSELIARYIMKHEVIDFEPVNNINVHL